MKFQTVKTDQTLQAEKIFREIVQNSVSGEYYNLWLVDKDKRKDLLNHITKLII